MVSQSQGRLALVTGASTGIGYELAIQFAKNGFDLLIVADEEGINEAKVALEKIGGKVYALQADLTQSESVEKVAQAVKDTGVRLTALALNAGRGASGDFLRGTTYDDDLKIIELNIVSTVHLAKLLLPELVQSGEGRILVTSSIASLSPGPFNAVYHASKAFVQSFTEAIREELRGCGVTITALMPGATETEFFARAHMLDTKVGQSKKDDPAEVAKQGFEAMMKGDDHVIAGSIMNKVQGVLSKFSTDAQKAKTVGSQNEPLEPGDTDSVDAVRLLKTQHREAEMLFARIKKADAGEGEAIFRTLAHKLLEHMIIEEEVFYPAAANVDADEIQQARADHQGAKDIIQQILSAKNPGAFMTLVNELERAIEDHIREEEDKVFPECKEAMTKDDLIELADEMRDLMIDVSEQWSHWAGRALGRSPLGAQEGSPLV